MPTYNVLCFTCTVVVVVRCLRVARVVQPVTTADNRPTIPTVVRVEVNVLAGVVALTDVIVYQTVRNTQPRLVS